MPKSFQARVRYAAQKLDRFGRWGEEPYSRTFDDCFEQYDGPVVVAALMQIATSAKVYCEWWPEAVAFLEVHPAPQEYIAKGIALMGGSVWEEWTKTAEGILAGATKSLRIVAKEMRQEATMPTNFYALPYQCAHDLVTKWKVVDKSTGSVEQAGFICHAEAKAYIKKRLAGRKA